ncbi:hypothetical protein [Octadecabacter antarcticus]|uniref:hypothetical protein n=1 Tax=Octadecabacter antarcticus TaxID=1217908 RepID=UPI0001807320|nr:hypothetical protein [Octadecabacter antarcticus]
MPMKVEQVPNVILGLRWGVLVLALIAMFVLEWSGMAFGLIVVGLGLSIAMRFARFRHWIAAKLTTGKSDQALK